MRSPALQNGPVALSGHFDSHFLTLPREVLITAMSHHLKCIALEDQEHRLQSRFIIINNTRSAQPDQVIHGYETVLHARLSDAVFFYQHDQKITLQQRVPLLDRIIVHQRLGSLGDRVQRLQQVGDQLCPLIQADSTLFQQASHIAKADLTTAMVNEFPELQGIMGSYYAQLQGASPACADIIRHHYHPRFAHDTLPDRPESLLLALADRVDMIIGIFGIGQQPTAHSDPYGLRRAALAIVRLITERSLPLSLRSLLTIGAAAYAPPYQLENSDHIVSQVHLFVIERLKFWYEEQHVAKDVIAAVLSRQQDDLLDLKHRLLALQQFLTSSTARDLITAHKRIHKLLHKTTDMIPESVDTTLLQLPAEQKLYDLLMQQWHKLAPPFASGTCQPMAYYHHLLQQLADLQAPIASFFQQVLIMVEQLDVRQNRLALLKKLHGVLTHTVDLSHIKISS